MKILFIDPVFSNRVNFIKKMVNIKFVLENQNALKTVSVFFCLLAFIDSRRNGGTRQSVSFNDCVKSFDLTLTFVSSATWPNLFIYLNIHHE